MAGLLNRVLRRADRAPEPAPVEMAEFNGEFQRVLDSLSVSVREPVEGDNGEMVPRVIVTAPRIGQFYMPGTRKELVDRIDARLPGHSPRSVERLADGIEAAVALALRSTSTPSEIAAGQPLVRRRRPWITAHEYDVAPDAPLTWRL